jgi:hypothetical protein
MMNYLPKNLFKKEEIKRKANRLRRCLKRNLLPLDLLADMPVQRLHFDGLEKHKSYVGAICSICMIVIFIIVAAVKMLPVIYSTRPQIMNIKDLLGSDEEIFYDDHTYKLFFRISDGVDDFTIDRTMIDIYVNHEFV